MENIMTQSTMTTPGVGDIDISLDSYRMIHAPGCSSVVQVKFADPVPIGDHEVVGVTLDQAAESISNGRINLSGVLVGTDAVLAGERYMVPGNLGWGDNTTVSIAVTVRSESEVMV